MKEIDGFTNDLYRRDEYIIKNPTLHAQDSAWKVRKILPLVDIFMRLIQKNVINLLDIGGGAGLILSAVSRYMEDTYAVKVSKFALDLSPGILNIQIENNPGLVKALNEDVRRTSLGNKEMDLCLMIDVLEHIPNPVEALQEIKRVSKYTIIKIPLEDNLLARIGNFINRGASRRLAMETVGHVNFYNYHNFRHQVERNAGKIMNSTFTNNFASFLDSEHYRHQLTAFNKLQYLVAANTYKVSPKLNSYVFSDSLVVLVRCS